MDVITLYQYGIQSIVAPLGTAFTEDQLNLSWQYSYKPTIMFDGDSAGLRAAYKTALMSLGHINAKRFIQFITLPKNEDPDSFVNNNSFDEFVKFLKYPISLVNFIFHQASLAHSYDKADDKIIFDKYIDEIMQRLGWYSLPFDYETFRKEFDDVKWKLDNVNRWVGETNKELKGLK